MFDLKHEGAWTSFSLVWLTAHWSTWTLVVDPRGPEPWWWTRGVLNPGGRPAGSWTLVVDPRGPEPWWWTRGVLNPGGRPTGSWTLVVDPPVLNPGGGPAGPELSWWTRRSWTLVVDPRGPDHPAAGGGAPIAACWAARDPRGTVNHCLYHSCVRARALALSLSLSHARTHAHARTHTHTHTHNSCSFKRQELAELAANHTHRHPHAPASELRAVRPAAAAPLSPSGGPSLPQRRPLSPPAAAPLSPSGGPSLPAGLHGTWRRPVRTEEKPTGQLCPLQGGKKRPWGSAVCLAHVRPLEPRSGLARRDVSPGVPRCPLAASRPPRSGLHLWLVDIQLLPRQIPYLHAGLPLVRRPACLGPHWRRMCLITFGIGRIPRGRHCVV